MINILFLKSKPVVCKYSSVSISMSHVGECYDKAQMESIFGQIKDDFYIFYNPKSEEELLKNINEYSNYYNNERIQIRLKMSSVMYSDSVPVK